MLQSPLDEPQSRPDDEPQSRLDEELYAMDEPQPQLDARRTPRGIKVHQNQLAVEGGWTKVKHVVETMTVSHDNGNSDEVFARVSTACQWLRCIITDNNERGRMRFLSVLKTCREKLDKLDEDASHSTAAVAVDAADDGADPMDALADMEDVPPAKKPKRPKKTIGGVRIIQMPKSPNAGSDTVDVRFYMQTAKTRPVLWISVGCLAWPLEYALAETTTAASAGDTAAAPAGGADGSAVSAGEHGTAASAGAGSTAASADGSGLAVSAEPNSGFDSMSEQLQARWLKHINKLIDTYIDLVPDADSVQYLQCAIKDSKLATIMGDPTGLVLFHFDAKQCGAQIVPC